MMDEQLTPELKDVLQDLGILSRSELSEAIFEAEQQSLSLWKHLRQSGKLTQKQADTLDMCQKGYIPVKVAKITLGMDLKAKPRNETKTVPAETNQPVEPKPKESSQNRTPSTPIAQLPSNSTDGKKNSKNFSSYLNIPAVPEKTEPVQPAPPQRVVEEIVPPKQVAQQAPAQVPAAMITPQPIAESSSQWPTKNARLIVNESLSDEEDEEPQEDSIYFKLRNTPPPKLDQKNLNSQDSTQHVPRYKEQGSTEYPKLRVDQSEGEMEKFFPHRSSRSQNISSANVSPTSNTNRSGKNKLRTDLSYLVGRRISKFQLSTQLGKGSAGTVFLAHHAALNMPVAIKILDPNLAKHYPELINRFMQEASSAARINHPNVIRVLDCDYVDGFYIIVMEYVDGISLSELIQMNGALSEDRGLKYILSVAEGLEAAYQVGIVHRDIKPANILITKTKQVRIADMGLARAIKDNNMSDTAHGVGLGTPQYFPPEQARDAASVDHRSDIYALGVTLYVVLCGELPFKAKSLSELVLQHETEYAIPLNVVNPAITQRTTNLVITMMQKHPDDRYQTYEALIQAIQSCIVECQTRSEDIGAGTSRSSFSVLNKLGNLFNRKT